MNRSLEHRLDAKEAERQYAQGLLDAAIEKLQHYQLSMPKRILASLKFRYETFRNKRE